MFCVSHHTLKKPKEEKVPERLLCRLCHSSLFHFLISLEDCDGNETKKKMMHQTGFSITILQRNQKVKQRRALLKSVNQPTLPPYTFYNNHRCIITLLVNIILLACSLSCLVQLVYHCICNSYHSYLFSFAVIPPSPAPRHLVANKMRTNKAVFDNSIIKFFLEKKFFSFSLFLIPFSSA